MAADLILDLGNTNHKLTLMGSPTKRYPLGHILFTESVPKLSLPILKSFIRSHPVTGRAIMASVIDHPPSLTTYLMREFPFILVDPFTPLPIKNKYRSPETLGYDRLAGAVAGAALFPGNEVLVINAGTCLTFDFVNRRGEYLGGSISPGMQLRLRALHTFTGKLPLLSYRNVSQTIGNDTETSLLTGVINGIIHEIEGVTAEYRRQFPGMKVVFSGGDRNYFVKRLKISIFALPNCVTYGLYQILQFNAHLS